MNTDQDLACEAGPGLTGRQPPLNSISHAGPSPMWDEATAAEAPAEQPARYQFTNHSNQLGDWCPWSHVKVTQNPADSDDTACPAGCPASDIEEIPADGR